MNFEAVRAFVAVAEDGQFQIAADQLGISQQAVSKRIAALESFLGTKLFERVASGAVLTADGVRFLPRAKAVLVAVKHAVESVRRESRPLRVDVLSRRLASAEILREFHLGHQAISIEILTTSGVDATIRGLLDGDIDAGFCYLREPIDRTDPQLAQSFAYFEPVQIVVSDRHPLAGHAAVRPDELTPFTAWVPGIVTGTEWAGFYEEFARAFRIDIDSTGPNFGFESLLDTIADSPALLTFVGEKTRGSWPEHQRLTRIPLARPKPLYPWSLIWHAGNQHPGLGELVRHVRRSFAPVAVREEVWLPDLVAPTRR
ncbi:LysR family transcriptional regulator [Saccharopolyspora phatthalungensis]|uniref:DNA-binding transcriptional LysR family regulator n=1 Tax=Saccharopolyspora phatthalungensis TaxID=664693 RepID=A0A840QKC3_9PSEU|nr:LysR family transcriptional regulator [Saccharopolyspora phatthalungensis]MBB5158773.1 DNA-binding transcriptional LysR family regulator [Saccharopolyspora phatthalungensis]